MAVPKISLAAFRRASYEDLDITTRVDAAPGMGHGRAVKRCEILGTSEALGVSGAE